MLCGMYMTKLLSSILFLPFVHGTLIILANTTSIELGPIKSDIIWNDPVNEENITLVNLIIDKELFNYCDLSQYSHPKAVSRLLEANFVNQTNTTKWAAMVVFKDTSMNLAQLCQGLDWHTSFIFMSSKLLALFIQRAGGSGML